MTLKDISIKEEYDSISGDDVHRDFFNQILTESHYYYRIGGKFTSKNFAMCAEGMQKFIENEGTMKLVLTPSFSEDDAIAISKGLKNAEEVISENWISSYDQISEKFVQDHTKALAWLLATGKLKIKIVIAYDKNGEVLNSDELSKIPIFQRKTGIFMDNYENVVSYYGSIDFEHKKYGRYYNLRVNRNWGEDREIKLVNNDWIEFQNFWKGEKLKAYSELNFKVIDLPIILEKKLLEIKPESIEDLPELFIPPVLRDYQNEAISNWFKNDKKGVFQMATGTGKTITAIGCLSKIIEDFDSTLIIVACPYSHLIDQWSEELEKWNLKSIRTNEDSKWKEKIKDSISALKLGSKCEIIITSYNIFSNKEFTDVIKSCPTPTFLIADEVHHAGSFESQKGLIPEYTFRLGLTATFNRYFDDEGTEILDQFFGGTVYTKTLQEAINEKQLVGYNYKIIPVEFTSDELIDYQKITIDIAIMFYSKDPHKFEKLKNMKLTRSRIIANAKNKIPALQKLLETTPNLKKQLLVFTTGELIEDVKINLIKSPHLYRSQEVTHKIPKKISERRKIFESLTTEKIDAIVSIGVLDEGVDIPSAKKCIIMSSTGNPKQFIQRRGRVLRVYKKPYPDKSLKENAEIYDMYVVPNFSSDDFQVKEYHKKLIYSQLERMNDMAKIAINKTECQKILTELRLRFEN